MTVMASIIWDFISIRGQFTDTYLAYISLNSILGL
jgi:hypothetical protein